MEKYRYAIFPFGDVKKDESIIIWGLGEVGDSYIRQITQTNYCKILFATDKNWSNKYGYLIDIKVQM